MIIGTVLSHSYLSCSLHDQENKLPNRHSQNDDPIFVS